MKDTRASAAATWRKALVPVLAAFGLLIVWLAASRPLGFVEHLRAKNGAARAELDPDKTGARGATLGAASDDVARRDVRSPNSAQHAPHAASASSVPSAPSAPAEEQPPAPAARPTEPLGLCGNQTLATQIERRLQLTKAFQQRVVEDVTFHVDPGISKAAFVQVLTNVVMARLRVEQTFDVKPKPPEFYLYADVATLHRWSCVHESAVAYYDGSIHLAPDRDGRWDSDQSAVHEYAHHVMTSQGITGPMWFREGVAMKLAKEQWWERAWLDGSAAAPLPMAEMVTSPSIHGMSEKEAVARYTQAALMVEILKVTGALPLRDHLTALRNGTTTADDLFAWSVRMDRATAERALREFVQTRGAAEPMHAWERAYLSAERQRLLDPASVRP